MATTDRGRLPQALHSLRMSTRCDCAEMCGKGFVKKYQASGNESRH
jgi:hypothetical protein